VTIAAPDSTSPSAAPEEARPRLSPGQQVVRSALLVLFTLSFGLLLQLLVVSSLQHNARQGQRFKDLRGALANGVASTGSVDQNGASLPLGSPLLYLEIPSIGVHEAVVEGTTSSTLFGGPGHRRDTVLPGQAGTSVVMGRRSTFGGPFNRLPELAKGAAIRATTAQGTFDFVVLDVRRDGDPMPAAPAAQHSRLVLITAGGSSLFPSGLLYVDADLKGDATGGPAPIHSAASLPTAERPMHGDTRTVWALVLWLQALLVAAVGSVWAFHRWGKPQAWIAFFPLLVLLGLAAAGELVRLLPNLM
jgi:LPXTG-site transpeptidase (sortase) family protein